jgi:tol-pal system protein YbgF
MKRLIVSLLLTMTVAGCASQPADAPLTPTVVPDPRTAQMQVALTELLEQLDVLNARIAKLEAAASETPARVVEVAAPPSAVADPSPIVAATQSRPQPHPAPVTAPSSSGSRMPSATSSIAAAELADAYRAAMMLYGRGRIAESRAAFQKVFDAEPTGELADNALFWIGETWFAAGNYTEATRYYRKVTTDFADQNKAPDALFKIAVAHEKSGDLALARQTLQELIRTYPYSSSADSAKRELERIKY